MQRNGGGMPDASFIDANTIDAASIDAKTTDASIIIAAWNAERTLANAIRSALGQTGLSIEVIVADDASADGTSAVAASIKDERLHYLRCPSNGGPSAARNAAIAASRGTWIAVLDADDTMLPGRLAALVGRACMHELDIVADNMWVEKLGAPRRLFIPESLDGTLERVTFEKFCVRNRLFGGVPGYGYLKPVFRAAFLRQAGLRYDTALRVGEDFNIVAEALALGARYGRVRTALYSYTVARGSVSDQLKAADARAMLAADDRFIARFASGLAARDRAAIALHRRSLHDGAAFIAMVDAIKNRQTGALLRLACRYPAALRHFDMPVRARLARARQFALRALRQPEHGVDLAEPVRAWGARR